MDTIGEQEKEQMKVTKAKTFPVPFGLEDIKESITQVRKSSLSQPSKEDIVNHAFKLHSQGNLLEASKHYQKLIDDGCSDHRILVNYGTILKSFGRLKEAEILTRKAIQLKPDLAMLHSNLGNILLDLGIFKEAERAIRKAIDLKPDYAEAHYNLGNVLKHLGKLQEAVFSFQKAIEIKPNYQNAFLNLGNILKDLGNLNEAEKWIRRAININPNYAGFHSNLALILLQKNEFDIALEYFLNSSSLIRNINNTDSHHPRFINISKAKINHDIEQFEYLVKKGYEIEKFTKLILLYKKVSREINWPSETEVISLSEQQQDLIIDSYNRIIHKIDAPKSEIEVVNNNLNVEKITYDYFNHEFGLTYIDNLLTPSALETLRKFLLESTIWFEVKKGGYLGAYLTEGLASPLIIQIADELRRKFPKIFKDYPISQIWAYKYDSRAKSQNNSLSGINVHADFAAVNVNFWVTPRAANLDPSSGGLIVYDVEAPKEWDFNKFNNDEKQIRNELKKSHGNKQIITYNENRAVIFNSNLFHETDKYIFKDGYENRRINITMLFGNRT